MDISIGYFDKRKKELVLSQANQNIIIALNGEIRIIEGSIFSIGGALSSEKNPDFRDTVIPVENTLYLYSFTDGYIDQFGGEEGNKFGMTRFKNLISSLSLLPVKDQFEILKNTFENYKMNEKQTDDVLVIALRII